MAVRQTDADKVQAMKEYQAQHNAAVDRIAALRAARLTRDTQLASEKPSTTRPRRRASPPTAR